VSKSTADEGIRVAVRVTPKSGRDALEGVAHDANGKSVLKTRISAAPEHGKANSALVLLLSEQFGVPKSAVTILRGIRTRVKQVHIRGDKEKLAARLAKIGEGV